MKSLDLQQPTLAVIERFSSKFVISDNGCWDWAGSIDSCGYGRFALYRKNRLAHRIMLSLTNGSLDPSLEIDHLCRNRKCVNPNHLEQVTSYENSKRGDLWSVNKRKTHCPKNHIYNDTNTRIRKIDGARECRVCDRLRPQRRVLV